MKTDRRMVLIVVGVALVVGGVLLGLLPVSTTTRGTDVSCGTAWFLRYDETQARSDRLFDAMTGGEGKSPGQAQCEVAAGSRGTIGFILGGLGGVALIVAYAVADQRRTR